MDIVTQLQRRYIDLSESLHHEGFVDKQFTELRRLQDEKNPDFVLEVVSVFYEDSEKYLNNILTALEQTQDVDFKQVDTSVHQLKGCSSSIGAAKVTNECITLRSFCESENREECLRCLQQVTHECILLKDRLETLFRLENQIIAAGGTIPEVD